MVVQRDGGSIVASLASVRDWTIFLLHAGYGNGTASIGNLTVGLSALLKRFLQIASIGDLPRSLDHAHPC